MVEEGAREYDLAILIILVVVCFPIALIYYFTRPKVKPQRRKPMRTCLGCGMQISPSFVACPYCNKEVEGWSPTQFS